MSFVQSDRSGDSRRKWGFLLNPIDTTLSKTKTSCLIPKKPCCQQGFLIGNQAMFSMTA
jgi:hypothetical protein